MILKMVAQSVDTGSWVSLTKMIEMKMKIVARGDDDHQQDLSVVVGSFETDTDQSCSCHKGLLTRRATGSDNQVMMEVMEVMSKMMVMFGGGDKNEGSNMLVR